MKTYYSDTVKFQRLNNPEVWVDIDSESTAMFQSYPFFEFAPLNGSEPLRYGDFVIDIDTGDTACIDAIKIINWMDEVFGVEAAQWRVYLSGKKGVHLELSAEVCGMEAGHVLLPMAYKRLAIEIQAELDVTLDIGMYNKGTGKPFRRPNVIREDTGTCKRQIDWSDLEEITEPEEYVDACSAPGDLWVPEDINRNELLADKLAFFLDEAGKTPEVKPLTEDQGRVLSAMVPPCINKLRTYDEKGLTEYGTFNDVAIQLTAYCISTGKSESEFLSGCQAFIENYPSSSLNTLEKRYQNASARYRNMLSNGYQHSCAGCQALLHEKSLCAGCPFQAVSPDGSNIEVMEPEDFAGEDNSLKIPDEAIPGGLIEQGLEALEADTLQYSLPLVLTVISRSIAGKISINGVYPNVFNIKVGGTSTGKTSADRKFLRCLDIDRFISVNEIASGAGLWRILADNPQGMGFFDEVTSLFQRNNSKGGVDTIAEGKSGALLDIFSRSGETFIKAFGDKKNNITITNPCFSLLGNATPTIFDAIQMRDFETGLMQRFDFWMYDGEIKPKPLLINSQYYQKTKDFIGDLRDIMLLEKPDQGLAGLIKGCVELDATPDAIDYIQEYSEYIIEEANKAGSDGLKGFMSRRFDLALKYALIHHGAMAGKKGLFLPINYADIKYGVLIAEMLGGWKSHILTGKVTSGDFHKDCETFKDAIRAAVKSGKSKPTFALLATRRVQLKNWPEKYSESIISVLRKRGEIITKEGRKSTQYFLPKKGVEND